MSWAVDDEERARRDRVRTKQLTGILVGYGYAVLAGSLWQPLSGEGISELNLALHAAALYIAPRGEP